MSLHQKIWPTIGALCLMTVIGLYIYTLYDKNNNLKQENAKLGQAINLYQEDLARVRSENATMTEKLRIAEADNTFFSDEINYMKSTVGVLDKLSKTDPELLKKYSKVYFLNENYIPKSLTIIPENYLNVKGKSLEIERRVWPHLQKLLDAATADGISLQVISAYRSFGTQAYLKSSYTVTYGAGTANKFSADQGYSEHQLGTTLDFTTPKIGTSFTGFDKDQAYIWLQNNAYKYGFTLSYPKGNSYYAFEPWHWRYVSIPLATYLHNNQKSFYDMDQREIDQFLANFFD